MMNPILLQKQLRENASDLNDFYKDLKMWGEDMKKKEESRQQPTDSNVGLKFGLNCCIII
jgi:hypothetical protein